MGMISRFSEHMELLSAMMARTGAVNRITGAAHEEASLRQAMLRCAACTEADACRIWLANAPEGANPPAFCRNAALLERLVENHG